MRKKLKPILTTEDGLLSKLFRKVIFDTGKINTLKYDIDKYLKKGGNKVKSSILKNVVDGEMTWKVFIFLIFEILKFKKITLKIVVTHESNIVTEHSLEVKPKNNSKKE